MSKVKDLNNLKECPTSYVLAINDTINVITGKWKIPILASLYFGKKRYSEMEK